MSGKKKRRAIVVFIILLLLIIGLPLIMIGISFIGRIAPDSIIPGSYDLYAGVPDPLRFVERVLSHEPLPEILALTELAPLEPMLNQLKDSKLTENSLVRFAAKGELTAAFFREGDILAAWNAGILSPLFRILPLVAGRFNIPGLYYVQAGKNSRFEFRPEDGSIFFIGPYKNLLVISNNPALYESVVNGSLREKNGPAVGKFNSRDHDIAFLLSPQALIKTLEDADPQVLSAVNLLQFNGQTEAYLEILPNQLKLHLTSPLDTDNEALRKIIERNSQGTPIMAMIPDNAQYMTLLGAGNLKELLDGVSAIAKASDAAEGGFGAEWENTLQRADSSARMALRMNLEELLFSWTGTEFSVYGLEGRPNPVIVLEIRDEQKRKEVFEKAFRSVFVSENLQLNLDGNRIPRIQLPGFLESLLKLMSVDIPSPYYLIQNNYLLISESAETLLAAVNSVRRNEVLPKQELWRTLSEDNSGPASFTLFYSQDHSLPFFLKGSSAATAVLRLYRQGLMRLYLENKNLSITLSVIPGAGRGLVPSTGFPLDLSAGGRVGNRLYRITDNKDSRLLLSRGGDVLAVNPLDQSIKEITIGAPSGTNLYIIPQGDLAWVLNTQGYVTLVNKNLENQRGFPLNTGIALSSPPEAFGGKLFIPGEDGTVHTVDNTASINFWGNFSAALRSPPSFLDSNGKTYAAVYPKSFFGEIILLDSGGFPLTGWPVHVPGIAFGSPLLFSTQYQDRQENLFTAFITQAGELAVYAETAEILQGFPLELNGVFYLQPVFDGEYLWIIESEGMLYRIGLDGEVLSHKIPRFSVKEEGYITSAFAAAYAAANTAGSRSNRDSLSDGVFFTGEGNALYGYSRNFASLDGFPLPVWGRPVIADVTGDGKIKLAGIGMDNKIYMWQFR